jgi:hypothetical protein
MAKIVWRDAAVRAMESVIQKLVNVHVHLDLKEVNAKKNVIVVSLD